MSRPLVIRATRLAPAKDPHGREHRAASLAWAFPPLGPIWLVRFANTKARRCDYRTRVEGSGPLDSVARGLVMLGIRHSNAMYEGVDIVRRGTAHDQPT